MLEAPTRVDEDAWAQIVAELTRRRFVAGGVAAGAALLLPGCGGDDGEGEASSTRVVETGKGRVRVPADPRRVAALGGGDVDTMLALGIEPVAAHKDITAPDGVPPWRKGRLDPARTKLIDVETGVPLEQVAALKPDLILSGFWGFDDCCHPRSGSASLRLWRPTRYGSASRSGWKRCIPRAMMPSTAGCRSDSMSFRLRPGAPACCGWRSPRRRSSPRLAPSRTA